MANVIYHENITNIKDCYQDTEYGRKWLHDKLGSYLINKMHIYTSNDHLFLYKESEGIFVQNDYDILKAIQFHVANAKDTFRKEVVKYCLIAAPEFRPQTNLNIIGCKDSAFNIETNEEIPYSADLFLQHKITAKYVADAYNESVDKFLDRITQNNKQLRMLIEEMIGYCLYRTARYQKCFVLSGGGSNGKSTLLDVIIEFLGTNNTSALSLKNLQDKFKVAQIKDKLANINDDVSNERIVDTELFKKLVVGGEFEAEQKNKNPFKMRNFGTIILSANEIPKSSDKTEGYFRRFIFIPLKARFGADLPDYDPNILDKLITENAKSYLLNLAIAGLKRLKANGRFTETEETKKEFTEYKEDNDPLFAFFNEYEITSVEGKTTDYIRDKFNDWHKNEYGRNSEYKKTTITRWLKSYNYSTEIKRVNGEIKRVYIKEQNSGFGITNNGSKSVTDSVTLCTQKDDKSVTLNLRPSLIPIEDDEELPF